MAERLREFLVSASIGGGRNFRPVAGFPARDGRVVASGRLYRSGFPGRLPQETLLHVHGAELKTVVTLQTRKELEILGRSVDEILPGVDWHHIPVGETWFEDSNPYPSGLDQVGDFYLAMVRDHPEAWRRFFEVLAGPKRLPLLYHCTAGRDRTGVATTLLLEVLGVSRRRIREDYLISNQAFEETVQEDLVLDPLFQAFDEARGVDRFLGELGVRPDVLREIRENLLVAPEEESSFRTTGS